MKMKCVSAEGGGSIWVRPGNESCSASNQQLHTPRAALSNTMPSALMCILLADVLKTSLLTYPRPLKRALHTHTHMRAKRAVASVDTCHMFTSQLYHILKKSRIQRRLGAFAVSFFGGWGVKMLAVFVRVCLCERKESTRLLCLLGFSLMHRAAYCQ